MFREVTIKGMLAVFVVIVTPIVATLLGRAQGGLDVED